MGLRAGGQTACIVVKFVGGLVGDSRYTPVPTAVTVTGAIVTFASDLLGPICLGCSWGDPDGSVIAVSYQKGIPLGYFNRVYWAHPEWFLGWRMVFEYNE